MLGLSVGDIEIQNSDHMFIISSVTTPCVIRSVSPPVSQVRNVNTDTFEKFKTVFSESDITGTLEDSYADLDVNVSYKILKSACSSILNSIASLRVKSCKTK